MSSGRCARIGRQGRQRLEPGKLADFAILEDDPYKVNPNRIKDIRVWGTALSGKLFKSDK